MYNLLLADAAAILEGYIHRRRFSRQGIAQLSGGNIKEIKTNLRDIMRENPCEYCGRTNKFVDNCKGCGAPCK